MNQPIRKHKVVACPECGARMAHENQLNICNECGFMYSD